MKYLVALLALLLGCAAPGPEHRVNITIKNETGRHVSLWAAAGILGRSIDLEPGEIETYWVDRRFTGNDLTVTIR